MQKLLIALNIFTILTLHCLQLISKLWHKSIGGMLQLAFFKQNDIDNDITFIEISENKTFFMHMAIISQMD